MRLRPLLMLALLFGVSDFLEAQTPSPPQPIPLGVNGQLAPWLQVRGEFRTRIEGFSGGGFADAEDAYWMDRFRLNATVRPSKSLAFVVQAQDSRAFDKTTGLAFLDERSAKLCSERPRNGAYRDGNAWERAESSVSAGMQGPRPRSHAEP